MAGPGRTFSESWHRIADQRISLRSSVNIRKQFFRGKKWYIIHDPFNNCFFRISPEAHEFVVRLRPDITVDQVWDECMKRSPDNAPGQDEVVQLLAQLYYSNLLYHELPPDSTMLFERYRHRKQRELKSRLFNIMFFRLPLIDPESILKKIGPLIRQLISPAGAIIWLITVMLAVKVVIDNFEGLAAQTQGVLAPANLIYLYAGLIMIKILHELGHAFSCKRFGGEVHTMGVMLMVFTPLPYMDATSSWSFQSRWQRALVGASGMIFEIFAASIAVFIWTGTGPGVIHGIAFNMMFIASVSTLLFNANPLLRYDGYYILSDLIDIPNLHSRSLSQLRHLSERYLFGYKDSFSPAQTGKEASWLTCFGLLSGTYRIFIFTVIILFVADRFLLLGLIMAFVCAISWVLVPVFRFFIYLLTSVHLERTRRRAIAVSAGSLAAVLLFLSIIPFPNRFRAPGVLEATEYVHVINDSDGFVKKVLLPTGSVVVAGTALMELSNDELDFEIAAVKAQLQETLTLQMRAVQQASSELEPINNRLKTINRKLMNLEQQKKSLVVSARQDGKWIAPRSREMKGRWFDRGSELGMIINHDSFRFSAVVSQEDASRLFDGNIRNAEVRLKGQAGETIIVSDYKFIPFKRDTLPSAALGRGAGGQVPVMVNDDTGLKVIDPFFQIYANLNKLQSIAFLHGRSGQIRFTLGPEPLLAQWTRNIRQLLQNRYQI